MLFRSGIIAPFNYVWGFYHLSEAMIVCQEIEDPTFLLICGAQFVQTNI